MKARCTITILIAVVLEACAALFIDSRLLLAAIEASVAAAALLSLTIFIRGPVREVRRRLEKTEEENRQLETMRREFVANVTHELKTPLTSISGFIETLQAGAVNDPEVSTKFLDIMSIETARLKRIIEDILVLSDIENKNEVIREDDIEISRVMESITEILKPVADSRGVKLVIDTQGDLHIRGDEDRFRQMMVNLIENAIKYSNPGGHVWITSKNDGDKTKVSVKDEGIGIAEENLGRLFERFYRVDKSRSRKVGGTGLGLSIVKHIAALFDAELNVESKLGEGSVFTVTFKS